MWPAMNYDADFYAWTKQQADALRRRAANEVDWDNLAEEIESVGRSERREIRSRLKILLIHLVKWRYQPDKQCPSWRASIGGARREIEDIIADNPSLRAHPAEALAGAWSRAIVDEAIYEIGPVRLPDACPWTIEEILSIEFLP
jgi:Domain of unknown function DUF29